MPIDRKIAPGGLLAEQASLFEKADAMTELQRIIIACFIGGALYSAVALTVPPAYLWLGPIVGFMASIIISRKRLLCGIDGMCGGFVSTVLLAVEFQSLPGRIAIVLLGGLIGTAFGIVDWKISQRIFRVPAKSSS